jgi:phosphoribosylformylglycinamidine synthase
MVVTNHGTVVADITAKKLADEAPIYHRESREPAYLRETRAFRLESAPDTTDALKDLEALMAWPSIASKNWVYRQYDTVVRSSTVVCPGSDAAVLRIKADSLPAGSALNSGPAFPEKFIAMAVDCNAVYVYLDPREGGKIAVAEAARNLACSGAVPLGTTDNLNFGNPHNPEIFYQIRESVEGLAEACRVFDAPVTGGNVSLYNQNPKGPVDPTPTVAMVGLIEKAEHITTQWFKDEGDEIVLLGEGLDLADPLFGLGGSAYLQTVHRLKTGTPPRCDLPREKAVHDATRNLIREGVVKSAHDCSEGGLAVALAESCISQQLARNTPRLIGARVDLREMPEPRVDALLFGEAQARILITVKAGAAAEVIRRAQAWGVPARQLGVVGGAQLEIRTARAKVEASLERLHDLWWNSIARAMKTPA